MPNNGTDKMHGVNLIVCVNPLAAILMSSLHALTGSCVPL